MQVCTQERHHYLLGPIWGGILRYGASVPRLRSHNGYSGFLLKWKQTKKKKKKPKRKDFHMRTAGGGDLSTLSL